MSGARTRVKPSRPHAVIRKPSDPARGAPRKVRPAPPAPREERASPRSLTTMTPHASHAVFVPRVPRDAPRHRRLFVRAGRQHRARGEHELRAHEHPAAELDDRPQPRSARAEPPRRRRRAKLHPHDEHGELRLLPTTHRHERLLRRFQAHLHPGWEWRPRA